MEQIIRFALSNFTLTFLMIGILVAFISLLCARKPVHKATITETLFAYFLLIGMGFSMFYNFVMHVFFGDLAAQFIGWANSPFQTEVGFASLGFAVVNMMAFKASWSFRAAAFIAPALFLLGAAGGHIVQMIVARNFAPGNAGIIFWTDLIIPFLGFAFLVLTKNKTEGTFQ
ncbi:DUF6790 family protein [Legionella quateirensis]|uniref:Transmembrane protein n=1 Tax=Legionella quateirensis TaxID=45072 RepID=A0A378KZ29_9GAMM|nr:DUF6790 family protein [Legionella quateirensis]KTD49303.1 hypothetical protein Lqua_1755 [Legionella quateirensis]STY19399.1 Uncharacterised protein [Legionella quateirensis]